MPTYETFTTLLAGSIGLLATNIKLHSVGQTRYAQIARYDRIWDELGEVQRLHQEDFCQALGSGLWALGSGLWALGYGLRA